MSHARISIDPAVMMGKPCIKGTRVTVELILRKLGAGRSFADLLEAYPHLTEDDVRAALAFAADYMQHETVLAAERCVLELDRLSNVAEAEAVAEVVSAHADKLLGNLVVIEPGRIRVRPLAT